MTKLLIVDDCEMTRRSIAQYFADQELTILEAGSSAECVRLCHAEQPDLVVMDVGLPDASGLLTIRMLHEYDARLPVILITATRSSDMVIEAMKLGAMDFLVKPIQKTRLQQLVARALESRRLMREPVAVGIGQDDGPEPTSGADSIVGCSAAMQEVYKAIGRVARQSMTVLICGESGTGKELVARAIYQHSERAMQPFLAVNCAAIPDALLESELFGHEQGAFTGADQLRIGRFEQCHNGTLFLDEVGDLTPAAQSKVLRVLQEQVFQRVGGKKNIQTDVRIIAATSRNLQDAAGGILFRPDLYYRLSVVQIDVPPLRERLDDLPALIKYFLKKFSHELRQGIPQVPSETLKVLTSYSWPGNIRQLQSVIKRALLKSQGSVIIPDMIMESLPEDKTIDPVGTSGNSSIDEFIRRELSNGSQSLYCDVLHMVERVLFDRVLDHAGGSQRQAAKVLGITRNTLRSKLKQLELSREPSETDSAKVTSLMNAT